MESRETTETLRNYIVIKQFIRRPFSFQNVIGETLQFRAVFFCSFPAQFIEWNEQQKMNYHLEIKIDNLVS